MGAQFKGVPFFHRQGAEGFPVEELSEEGQGLCRGDDLRLRILPRKGQDASGVVRFHVMDHEIIRLPAMESRFQILQPFPGHPGIDRIHYGHFRVQDEIGIVGHAFRHDILALEQVQFQVVDPDVLDIVCDAFDHIVSSLILQI